MWMKCRKKPITVEYREVKPLLDLPSNTEGGGEYHVGEVIKTREGNLYAYVGLDFIIRGVRGEVYPIVKDIFYETYDTLE